MIRSACIGCLEEQNAVYNGQKWKCSTKFEFTILPVGQLLHANGPVEGCRHEWALFVRSNSLKLLDAVCSLSRMQHCMHEDMKTADRISVERLMISFKTHRFPRKWR